jgi:starch synthase
MHRDLQFVAVGTGDGKYMEMFSKTASSHPSRMSANMRFDKDLANKVYAGADMFLMPSKSEPCGLSQLIAMRYGTVPIVRETGGLRDTVTPLDINTLSGRGFTFKSYNAHDMLDAIDRALSFYRDGEKWNAHVKNLIKYNSGWSESVKEYLKIYGELCN